MKTRINKHLSSQGICSRREADRLIRDGKVTLNGKVASLGDMVGEGDVVRVNGRAVKTDAAGRTYIMLNKPVGAITTTDRSRTDTVMDLIDLEERVFPIGRLDVRSSGLLLLTNDGELANRLMHPRYRHEKEYIVTTRHAMNRSAIARLRDGVDLDDGPTLPAKIRALGPRKISLTIREGRNRQVRRMIEAVGNEVAALERVRIGTLELGTLAEGTWRRLTKKESVTLRRSAGLKD